MSRQVRKAKKFVRGRRFLIAASLVLVVVLAGVVGRGSFNANAAVAGDTSCGYGTTQFTESTVMRWAQTTGVGLTGANQATFEAYANDENSTLLGVNSATPNTSSPQHFPNADGGDPTQHDGVALTGSEALRPYSPSLYITPVSGPGNWTTPGNAIPQAAGDWQQGGTARNISNGTNSTVTTGHAFVDDLFGTWVVGTQTVNPSGAPGLVGTLANGPLSTTVNTTHLDLQSALTKTVNSGDSLTVATTGHTIAFVATGGPYSSGTTINVVGKKSNFAYPNGSTITDTTAQTGNYARQSTLPAKNDWNLGTFNASGSTGANADPVVGTTFTSMGTEGYGTEFRWKANSLTDYTGAALTTGQWYKVQVVEHDGDQNKGGDSGEFCTLIKIPGPPDIKTDPTGGTDITGPNVDGHIKQWIGSTIKDTAFLPAKTGFGNVTGTVTFNLYFDANHAPNPAGSCVNATDAPPGSLVHTFSNVALDGNDPSVATSGTYDTAGHGFGTYYWQDVFTPGGSNASSYTTVTEACGAQTDQMVNARVRLTPHTAVNVIGANHTLSAFVETTTDGSAFSAVSGADVTTSLSPAGNSATYVPNTVAGSKCTTAVQAGPNPPAGTYCQVTITDSIVETVFVNASSTFTATGVSGGVNGDDSITKSTDNSAACESDNATGATCEAIKHWINPKTTLTVSDTLKGLGSGATGSIQYTGYTSLTDCQGTTTNAGTTYDLTPLSNTVSGDVAPTSKTVDVAPGVTIYFTAHYTGNEGDLTTQCTAESATSN
jgi:hypothetical protein